MANNQRYHGDNWTLDNAFGMAALGDHLARLALEAPPPFAIRVTGKWGTGKTSVLKRAFATLGGNPISQTVPLGPDRKEAGNNDWTNHAHNASVTRREELGWQDKPELVQLALQSPCVWYSPWQHQAGDNPLVPLLLEIRNQFNAWAQTKTGFKENLRPVLMTGLTLLERGIDAAVSLARGKSMKLATGTTESVVKTYKENRQNLTDIGDGQRFHLLFEDAVEQLLDATFKAVEAQHKLDKRKRKRGDTIVEKEIVKSKLPRLVVFIDDLDRCEEEIVIRLLESIKLYLSTSNCVFVFGLDDAAVLRALGRWNEREEIENREYLEKLFQTTLPVPQPDPACLTVYLEDQLKAHGFHPRGKIVDADGKQSDQEYCLADEMICLLEPNPRKIKNFANSLCAAYALVGKLDLRTQLQFLACQYLRLFHGPIWRLIERQPALFQLLLQVLIKQTAQIKGIKEV